MSAVTLRWEDPEDARQFLALRRNLRDHGWLPDTSAEALRELVGASEVVDAPKGQE